MSKYFESTAINSTYLLNCHRDCFSAFGSSAVTVFTFFLVLFCFVQFFLEAIFSCNLSGFVSYCQSHLVVGVRMARSVLLPEKLKQL
jgi:membrane-bound metal-dependent hydrolase YbcI (DUF457 family)